MKMHRAAQLVATVAERLPKPILSQLVNNLVTLWQAEDRVHRKGQLRGVNVYSFWTQKTIEERIHQKLQERRLLFDEVVNSLSETDVEQTISTDDWLDMLGVPRSGRQQRN
jgi:hypothetical protein